MQEGHPIYKIIKDGWLVYKTKGSTRPVVQLYPHLGIKDMNEFMGELGYPLQALDVRLLRPFITFTLDT